MLESDLHQITHQATLHRSTPLSFMTQCTLDYIANPAKIPLRPEPKTSVNKRRSTMRKLIKRYLSYAQQRDTLYGEAYLLRQRIAELTKGSTDNFSLFNNSAEYHELLQELAETEQTLLDPNIGTGILQDISNLLSDDRVINADEIGAATHMLLSTPNGTLSIPLKIRNRQVWLGSLPLGSIVIINNIKVVI